MSPEQKLILSVSSSAGYIMTRSHANDLRRIFDQPELTQEQYDAAVRTCETLGRGKVIALHHEAIDRFAQQFPPAP